ncbi:MAG: hypothetical protein R2716_05895 [Microthrixaceae bacterium]
MRHLLFCDGADIADPGVLAAVAERHGVGFDPDDEGAHRGAVAADYEHGEELGVTELAPLLHLRW